MITCLLQYPIFGSDGKSTHFCSRDDARTRSACDLSQYLPSTATPAKNHTDDLVPNLQLVALYIQRSVEGRIYNVLEGANRSLFARNILNAAGYMTFASGTAQVACAHSGTRLRGNSSTWLFVLSGVISTTIRFQDLYDQKGDAICGRRTIPLIAGDKVARLTVGIPVAIWSWVCPAFWGLKFPGFILPIALGATIIFRRYSYRSEHEDKKSCVI